MQALAHPQRHRDDRGAYGTPESVSMRAESADRRATVGDEQASSLGCEPDAAMSLVRCAGGARGACGWAIHPRNSVKTSSPCRWSRSRANQWGRLQQAVEARGARAGRRPGRARSSGCRRRGKDAEVWPARGFHGAVSGSLIRALCARRSRPAPAAGRGHCVGGHHVGSRESSRQRARSSGVRRRGLPPAESPELLLVEG